MSASPVVFQRFKPRTGRFITINFGRYVLLGRHVLDIVKRSLPVPQSCYPARPSMFLFRINCFYCGRLELASLDLCSGFRK